MSARVPRADRREPSAGVWHVATVVDSRPETPTARRIELDVPTWPGNDAGSHLDVRLTAPDGYQATRSYSIASAGEGTRVVLAVDELPDGEVSPFLVHDLRAGDQLELHGPLGAFFVWTPPARATSPAPGAAHRGRLGRRAAVRDGRRARRRPRIRREFRLLYSVRTPDDVFFRDELAALAAATPPLQLDFVYTRRAPDGWPTAPGRLTRDAAGCRSPARGIPPRWCTSAARRRSSRRSRDG